MHRLIIGAKDGELVDHVNGNGLDNRRGNLRLATKQQNAFNAKKTRGTSRYKGVCYEAKSSLWRAYIRVNGKRISLGRFQSEIDAANTYDTAAKEHFGEYARTNFSD